LVAGGRGFGLGNISAEDFDCRDIRLVLCEPLSLELEIVEDNGSQNTRLESSEDSKIIAYVNCRF